jgi:hypothetical protein
MPTRKRLFFDTEFTGLHQETTLISIGIVSEENQRFYAEFTDYDENQVDDWVESNVIQRLQFQGEADNYFKKVNDLHWQVKGDTEWVKSHLIDFLDPFDAVEIWSDNLAYDWVLFCQIFGHAFNIPKQVYYIPFDLATLLYTKGIDPDVKREDFVKEYLDKGKVSNKHNALWDAELVKLCFEKANSIKIK